MRLFHRNHHKVLPKPIRFGKPIMGIVAEAISPDKPGRVKCQATYWPAKFCQTNCQNTLEKSQSVTVVGREGITLLVLGT